MGKTHYMVSMDKSACGRKISNDFDVCVSWDFTDCKHCLKHEPLSKSQLSIKIAEICSKRKDYES